MRVISGVWVLVWLGAAGCSARGASDRTGSDRTASNVQMAVLPALAVGPEIGTETPVLVQKDLGWNPSVASDGSGFLSAVTIADRIRAVRVDAGGRVLDPYWLDLGGDFQQIYPNIAFGGGHYLVTWTEPDRAVDPNDPDDRATDSIRGRFVRPNGSLEGSTSFVISSGDSLYSSAAWDGSHFIVAWLGFESSGTNVHTALLDANGARVSGSEHIVSTSGHVSDPQLAVSGTQAFVTWYDYSSSDTGSTSVIYGARVAADGSVIDPGGQPLSGANGYSSSIDVTSDGTNFLTVWQTSDDPSAVRGSLVSAGGAVLVKDIALSDSSAGAGLPSAIFDGTEYLVAWASDREEHGLYGVHVSTSGTVTDTETRLGAGATRSGAFGSDRTNLAASSDRLLLTFLGTGVQGTLLSPNLDVVADTIGLTSVPNAQGYPQAVWNGANYLVTTISELADFSQTSLRAVRIDAHGTVLDPAGLLLSTDVPAFGSALASTHRGSALASWANSDDVHSQGLRSVASSGALGAMKTFPATETFSSLALAGNGATYFAVIDNTTTNKVDGYIVDASGDAGDKIEIADSPAGYGSQVFAAGAGFLVSFNAPNTQIVSVSAAGAVGTPIPLSASGVFPHVATNGEHSLIVWSGSSEPTLYGQLFEGGALVGAPFVISEQSAGFGASVIWDGSNYFVAWDLENYTQIQGRFIAADGTLGDVISLADVEVSGPVLSSDGNGQMLLSYLRWLEHAQTRRVTSRLLGHGADSGGSGGTGSGGAAGGGSGGVIDAGGAGQSGGGSANAGSSGQNTSGSSGSAGQSSGGAASGGASSGGSSAGGLSSAGRGGVIGSGGGGGLPQVPGCSTSPSRSSGSASVVLSLLAALAAMIRRRRQHSI